MRAMILAAGRGERMGVLTAETPKPLLRVAGKYLIEYSLTALSSVGIKDVVINVCYGKDLIKSALGDGRQYDLEIHYSEETIALETGGGIYQALPLLGNEPFIVLSSDVITHFPLSQLPKEPKGLAHVVLVDNPHYHPQGDFTLTDDLVTLTGSPLYTFSNISVLRPELFAACQPGYFGLGDLLKKAIQLNQVTGEHYPGLWFNLGTPQELSLANEALESAKVFPA